MINLSEDYAPAPEPTKFEPGDVILHKRYGYRGVIVDYDSSCQAPMDWYQANQTQPDRQQPWYHVLVDGNQQVTYVAESNLEPDTTGLPVVHGMLNLFFQGMTNRKTSIYAIRYLGIRAIHPMHLLHHLRLILPRHRLHRNTEASFSVLDTQN